MIINNPKINVKVKRYGVKYFFITILLRGVPMEYIIIILKSIFVYVYLICLLRFLGKKEFSQLSVFDFVVFLIIAELMTMSFDETLPEMLDSVIATLSLVILDKISSSLSMTSKKLRDFLDGTPSYIITNGKVNQKMMRKLKYNVDALCQQLRQQQIGSISEVEFAILETNGTLSTLLKKDCQVAHPEPVIIDGEIIKDILTTLNKDENWLVNELKRHHVQDYHDVFYCVVEKERLFFIMK
mgnify:FL=1